MGCFVGTVCHKGVNIRKPFDHVVVYIVKRYAVMNIAGGNFYRKNNTVDITGSMCFIGQLLFVVTLDKQTTVWVCGAFYYGFCFLCFLFALFQLLSGSVVTLLLR